jgi:quercetin dioxygenase-like cupin family protein
MVAVHRFEEFKQIVGQPLAVRVGGEVFPFRCEEPPLREVVAQARAEPQARIATGTRGDTLLQSLRDYRAEFRSLPLEEAMRAPVHLTLFDLGALARPGGALYGIVEQVYRPLLRLWADHGLRWKRAWPILFLSGPGCSTNYHWDPDDVFFIMLSGHKRFYALNEPRRWLTPEMLQAARDNPADLSNRARPAGIGPADIRAFDMAPGDALWNPIHAPHWVDADDKTAFSLSIAFTDVAFAPSSERVMATDFFPDGVLK